MRSSRSGNAGEFGENYKGHLFIKLFHDKENLLELYNALNGTDYKNPEDLVITTIDDAVYMVKN